MTPSPRNDGARRPSDAVRVGLAFGGGLPFGLVALGVLRAFREHGVPIARLAGTSMGSIIAASYAAGIPIEDCVERFRGAFSRRRILSVLLRDLSFSPSGVFKGEEVVHMLEGFIGKDRTFEDLEIPLRIPACDLADGSEVVFESGPLVPAIRASISLPGLFTPFRYRGRVLVDGALVRPIPVHLLRAGEVDLKIPVRAVRRRSRRQLHDDLDAERRSHRRRVLLGAPAENLFAVMWRSLSLIMQDEFAEMIFDDYDVYIRPELDLELSRDPTRMDEIVEAGYRAAVDTMPAVREAMAAAARNDNRTRCAGCGADPLGEAIAREVDD